MLINVNGLFKSIELGNINGIRCTETVVMRVQNGHNYKIVKSTCKNGKMGDFLEIPDDKEEEGIIEFFQNYMREGRLQKNTKKLIQTYIKSLKRKINNQQYNSKYIQERISLNERGDENMYSNEFKYIYKSSKYEISEIIDFIIKSRILKISPYILIKEKGYNAGTVGTWYKSSNELRILYSLYSMPVEEINIKFKEYDKQQVIEFNHQIQDLVIKCNEIDEGLKDKYIKKINNFNLSLNLKDNNNEMNSNINKITAENKEINRNDNSNIIKVITQNEEMWNAFANTNREKIFEILYNDQEILSMLIEQIYI